MRTWLHAMVMSAVVMFSSSIYVCNMISKILTSVLSLLITVTSTLPTAPTPLVVLTVPVSMDSLVMELTAQVRKILFLFTALCKCQY